MENFRIRQQALSDISKGYNDIRKEAEANKEDNTVDLNIKGDNDNMTDTEKIELLTKAVADLAVKVNGEDNSEGGAGNE